MNIDLRFSCQPEQKVLVSFGKPQLIRGVGTHSLEIAASIIKHEAPTGCVYLQGQSRIKAGAGGPLWLGNWIAPPTYLRDGGVDSGESLHIPVTDEQLWQFEDIRQGLNVEIELLISATFSMSGWVYPMINTVNYRLWVDSDAWLKQLDNIEHVARFVIGVPAGMPGGLGMASVARLLRQARDAYKDNRDDDAANVIRKLMELMPRIFPIMPTADALKKVGAHDRDSLQRWTQLYYSFLPVLNGSIHNDEATERIIFDRRDGQAIIAISYALIGRHWE